MLGRAGFKCCCLRGPSSCLANPAHSRPLSPLLTHHPTGRAGGRSERVERAGPRVPGPRAGGGGHCRLPARRRHHQVQRGHRQGQRGAALWGALDRLALGGCWICSAQGFLIPCHQNAHKPWPLLTLRRLPSHTACAGRAARRPGQVPADGAQEGQGPQGRLGARLRLRQDAGAGPAGGLHRRGRGGTPGQPAGRGRSVR